MVAGPDAEAGVVVRRERVELHELLVARGSEAEARTVEAGGVVDDDRSDRLRAAV